MMTSGVILFALVRLQIKCSLFSDKIIQAVAPNLRSTNVWSRNFAKRIHAPITDITKCPLIVMHTRTQSIILDMK